MTAIEAHEPANGNDVPFDLDRVLHAAAVASAAAAAVSTAATAAIAAADAVADADARDRDPSLALGRRLTALLDGNGTERELARFAMRVIDLAEDTRRTDDDDDVADNGADTTRADGDIDDDAADGDHDAHADDNGDRDDAAVSPSAYVVALRGVDAFESILSAAEAGKARAITEAYAHAREEMSDPTLSPGQRRKHTDGSTDHALSLEQITGADLSVITQQPPGLAKINVTRAVKLVQYMPHTLARLDAGELSGYQQRLIMQEASLYPPELAGRLDELVCATPFTGRHVGIGDHRVTNRAFKNRLNNAVAVIGYTPPETKERRSGAAGRFVRFGLTGPDGMTRLHGLLPALHAKAIDTLLDDLAALAPEKDERTIEQRRADVFLTCFTGPAALSPAAQLDLGYQAATFDETGHYTVVDEPQNLHAQSIWATIHLLAACLGLTFPDVPRATVTVDVTLETLTGAPCTTYTKSPPGPAPSGSPPPGDTSRPYALMRTSAESPPPPSDTGEPYALMRVSATKCPQHGNVRQACWASGTLGRLCPPSTPRTSSADSDDPCCDRLLREVSPAGAAARHRDATIRGLGDIPTDLAQRLARFADLKRVVTDPLTGQPLEVGRRQPNQRLRDAVLNRDRHCRFPGCTRTAAPDLDHLAPYRDDAPADGQTAPQNLEALCREHHRVKHQLHWHPDMQPDGTILWRNNLLDITATT